MDKVNINPYQINNDMSNLAIVRATRGRNFLNSIYKNIPITTTDDYPTVLQHMLDILHFYCLVNVMDDVLNQQNIIHQSYTPSAVESLIKKQERDRILVSSDCAEHTIESLLQTQVNIVEKVHNFKIMLKS